MVPTVGTTFTYNAEPGRREDRPHPGARVGRRRRRLRLLPRPVLAAAGRTIAQTPTGDAGPSALGAQRLPFVAVLPNGKAPAGGFPTTLFGHGFTRTDADVLLASTTNVGSGVATVATDVVGHGFGPASTWSFTRAGKTTTVPAYGRGVDQNGDGNITNFEGSSTLPNGASAAVSNRDGLRQTAADNMTLLRAVARGLNVSGTAASELRPTNIGYEGQSFGGIYGAMLAGADPKVFRSALNVAGGPVTEVARLGAFRALVQQSLAYVGLLNSPDPARNNFQEDQPLRGQAPVVDPVPGALKIQDFLAQTTWLDRSGDPTAFAPRIAPARVLLQNALGDRTVPNPTTFTLLNAGGLFGRESLYRNDRTAQAGLDPHGFLLNGVQFTLPFLQGQGEILTFLTTGKTVDPDGKAGIWQVPAPRQLLLNLNFPNPALP